MKQNTKFKIIVIASVGAVLFTSIASYSFYKAFANDENLMQKIETALKTSSNGNFNISFSSDDEGGSSTASAVTWSFAGKTEQIVIKSITADIEIIPTDADGITVKATGQVKKKHGVLLKTEYLQNRLSVTEPDNSETKDVKINVYVPTAYAKDIQIVTISGNINVGKIDLQKINAKSVSGEILIQANDQKEIEVTSVSGDVKISFKNPASIEPHLKTVSGDIQNTLKLSKPGTTPVCVKTVSGDITLE